MRTPEKTDLRILLLEDSDLDAELLIRELKKREIFFVSHRVQTRAEFARGVAEFQPELILADYKLPGFDGGQALSIARQCCPDVPVIIVSGAVGEETAVELLKDGATDFVLKDRLSGRLVPAIHRAMREVAERDSRRQAEAALRELNAQLEAARRRAHPRTRREKRPHGRGSGNGPRAPDDLPPQPFPDPPARRDPGGERRQILQHPASDQLGERGLL